MKLPLGRNKLFTILCLLAYIACVGVLVVESCLPGKVSADHSNQVGGDIADIINQGAGDQTVLVEPIGVEVVNAKDKVGINDTLNLNIKTIPEDSSFKSYIFSSSDESIATVSNQGKVTYKKEGNVTIYVENKDYPNVKTSFNTQVNYIDVISINSSISSNEHSNITKKDDIYYLYKGLYYFVRTAFNPSNTTDKTCDYEVDDNPYIELENNKILAKEISGDVVTTLTITSKNVSSTIKVKVIEKDGDKIPLESIVVSKETIEFPLHYSIDLARNSLISISLNPSDTSFKSYKIESTSEHIKITNQTKIETISAGEAIVKIVSLYDESIYTTLKIIINNQNIIKFADEPLTITQDENEMSLNNGMYVFENGVPGRISVNFLEESTFKEAYYEVDNEEILTVGDDGIINPVKAGTTTIKVIIDDKIDDPIIYEIKIKIKRQDLIVDLNAFFYKVRKGLGHFSAFLVLGICSTFLFMGLFSNKKAPLAIVINAVQGFFIASLTEFIQYFVEGRYGCFDDVILDYEGFLVSFVIFTILILLVRFIKSRKENNYE